MTQTVSTTPVLIRPGSRVTIASEDHYLSPGWHQIRDSKVVCKVIETDSKGRVRIEAPQTRHWIWLRADEVEIVKG